MARRVTPAQLRSQIRQAQQKQRQAVNKYNAAARKHNASVKRAVDSYNREVRAHNARVRSNQQRLKSEIQRLRSTSTTRYVTYQQSVVTLRRSFVSVESAVDDGRWTGGDDLLNMAEGETANSVAVLNALADEPAQTEDESVYATLQATSLTEDLIAMSPDLHDRWRGALFALSPRNPDAARHFCTSAREIITNILESEAPDQVVLEANPAADRTREGRVTRRARIRYCLDHRGIDAELVTFVEDDIDNVVALFQEFNDATHGEAGRYDLSQLAAIKRRVEDAVAFLIRVLGRR